MRILHVILIFIILGCTSKNDDLWFLKKDKNYNRVKEVFAKYLNHFPAHNTVKEVNYTWSLNSEREYNLKVVFSFKKENFNKTQEEIKKCAIAKYSAISDSLLVLNRFSTYENYGYPSKDSIKEELINQNYYKDLYPIPNFANLSDYQANNTACKLSGDFEIYVLESKPGKYLDTTILTDGKYMPEKWKNGYSKGVSISEERKIIIYWVIIW